LSLNLNGERLLSVLLAEDNLLNQELILMMLESLGHSADVAGNGLEAVEAVKSGSYDVVLMDLQMPKMDGAAAAREIIALLGVDRPRMIALTATATATRGPETEQLFDEFISKPISRDGLQRLLRGISSRKSEQTSAQDLQTLDLAQFVESSGDDPELQRQFAELYREDLSVGLKNLSSAVAALDLQQISALAHAMKGSSLSMGGARVAELLGELEGCISWTETGPLPRLHRLTRAISEESERVYVALAEAVPSMSL
jgi:CheY-like chemotaxis protein